MLRWNKVAKCCKIWQILSIWIVKSENPCILFHFDLEKRKKNYIHFIKHKPLISEECVISYLTNVKSNIFIFSTTCQIKTPMFLFVVPSQVDRYQIHRHLYFSLCSYLIRAELQIHNIKFLSFHNLVFKPSSRSTSTSRARIVNTKYA